MVTVWSISLLSRPKMSEQDSQEVDQPSQPSHKAVRQMICKEIAAALAILPPLASSCAPIPAKLVKCIQSLELTEMRELLPDNMALTEWLEALPTRLGEQAKQAEQREIGLLITWVSSFITYVAIVAEAHPERV